eukprot:7318621-Prymnesium_polylepis.1
MLQRVACNESATTAAVASLQEDTASALRWVYRQHAAATGGLLGREGISRALLRLEAQGQSWHPTVDSEFGSQRQHVLDGLLAKCATAGRATLSFHEFVWVLTLLAGARALEFAVILRDSTEYSRRVRAEASLQNRTPAVCGPAALTGPPLIVINVTVSRMRESNRTAESNCGLCAHPQRSDWPCSLSTLACAPPPARCSEGRSGATTRRSRAAIKGTGRRCVSPSRRW